MYVEQGIEGLIVKTDRLRRKVYHIGMKGVDQGCDGGACWQLEQVVPGMSEIVYLQRILLYFLLNVELRFCEPHQWCVHGWVCFLTLSEGMI